MAVTIVVGTQRRDFGVFAAVATHAEVSATTEIALTLTAPVIDISGGTAATDGATGGRFNLAAGDEGQDLVIVMTGTGHTKIQVPNMATGRVGSIFSEVTTTIATGTDFIINTSATGGIVFTASNQYVAMKFFNSTWHIMSAGGTVLYTSTTATT